MKKRHGLFVNDPNANVLVDNVSGTIVGLTRYDGKDVLVHPGETIQLTWAEYTNLKTRPRVGRFFRLNDTVQIIDGQVKISNVVGSLTDNEMISAFVQDMPRIKEFCLTLNAAETKVFETFLEGRRAIEVEPEKCTAIIEFMHRLDKERKETLVEESKSIESAEPPVKTPSSKKKRADKPAIEDTGE